MILEKRPIERWERGKVAGKMWERSAAGEKALQYATFLYLEHVIRAVTNNAVYMEHTNWEKCVIYELQSPKLPSSF